MVVVEREERVGLLNHRAYSGDREARVGARGGVVGPTRRR